jgi:hypothetical protein
MKRTNNAVNPEPPAARDLALLDVTGGGLAAVRRKNLATGGDGPVKSATSGVQAMATP